MKDVLRNGVSSTASHPSYEPSLTNPTKKHIMFANNSCHPLNNSISNIKNLSPSLTKTDLCQKRWFLVLLICLATIAAFNLSITFWIINVLKLTDVGIGFGSVVLTKKGIDISSDITFDGPLSARLIKPLDTKQSLVFSSGDSDKMVIKNNQYFDNALTLGDGKLEVQSNSFQIRSTNPLNDDIGDDILFNVEPNQITTYAKNFLQPTLGGHKIINGLETNSIKGSLFHDLRLESRTQSVDIKAQNQIHLESRGGDILVQSYDNTVLGAIDDIIVDSQRLEIKQMPRIQRAIDESNVMNSYQLCLCESGVLFATQPDGVCKSDADWCLTTSEG